MLSACAAAGARPAASASAIRAGRVHRRGHFPLVTVGWHADDKPGPVGMCLGLHGDPGGAGQLLIVQATVGDRPGQR